MFLFRFEPEKVINFMSSKIKKFFLKYPNFKLFLFKLQYFRNILLEKTKEEINNFYLIYILPLIINKSNYNEIENNLLEIRDNCNMIKCKSYTLICEECINLFIIGLKIALNEILINKNTNFIHKCNNCINCKERELYRCKYSKIETIEEEIINKYKENNYNYKNFCNFSSINHNSYLFDNDLNFSFDENEYQIINFQFDNNNNYIINNNNNCEIFNDSLMVESIIKNGYENNYNKKLNNNIKNIKLNTSISKYHILYRKKKLKEFQFKFTKRENIDKKILRKFRKFLKEKSIKNDIEIINIISISKFWSDFIKENLLPPFHYLTEKKKFRSFNTTYMSWIFEHKFSLELYSIFIESSFKSLCEHFKFIYNLNEENKEFNQLKIYLNNLPFIFSLTDYNQSFIKNSTDCKYDNKKEFDGLDNNINYDENKSFNYLKDNDIFNDLFKDKK